MGNGDEIIRRKDQTRELEVCLETGDMPKNDLEDSLKSVLLGCHRILSLLNEL